MATRNHLFPSIQKSTSFSKSRCATAPSKTLNSAVKSSLGSIPAKPITVSFNDQGVVLKPDFVMNRPIFAKEDIEFTITAYKKESGRWAAEFFYVQRSGSIPLFGRPLKRESADFATRSDAVDDAFNRGLRSVKERPHPTSQTKQWKAKVAELETWMAESIIQVRANDEGLIFRNLTGIDLCSGVGGSSLGMVSQGMKIKLACEINPSERSVYEHAIRPEMMHDDICTLLDFCKSKSIKLKADIAFMGLICKAFATSGNSLGFDDPVLRSTYLGSMEVLEAVDAKVIIVECAPTLLTLDGGKHGDELIRRMMMRNYQVQHQILNASQFGVPQERKRSVLVFTRMDMETDPIMGYLFPEVQAPTTTVQDILEPNISATIPDSKIVWTGVEPTSRATRRHKLGHINGKTYQGYRVYSTNGLGITLTASSGGACRFSGAYRVKGGARALTPREAYRMQGIAEYVKHHSNPNDAMRHAGNAVAVPMARELIRQLGQIFEKRD